MQLFLLLNGFSPPHINHSLSSKNVRIKMFSNFAMFVAQSLLSNEFCLCILQKKDYWRHFFVAKLVPLLFTQNHSNLLIGDTAELFLLTSFSNLDYCWSYMALSDIPRHGKTEKTEGSKKKKYSVAILLIDSLSQLSLTRWWGSGFCSPWISSQNVLIL